MGIISFLFKKILYQPLFNLLVFLYNIIPGHDFGLAIILLILIVEILLYPINQRALKTQKALAELQPEIKKIQEKYKSNREKQGLALMELYRVHKINPFTSLIPLFIQFPIIIALYRVFLTGLDPNQLNGLYSFIKNPGVINPIFLGIFDLSRTSIILAVFAGIFQFIQSKIVFSQNQKKIKKEDFSSLINQQMRYMAPFITILVASKLPAGLALYWTIRNIFSIIQQRFIKSATKI